jgi:hypothetical protein
MGFLQSNPERWLRFANRLALILTAIGLMAICCLTFLIDVSPIKDVLTMRRYMEIRHSVRTGETTEDFVKESLGEEYADYRRFVDSLSD